jgi:proton-translocating NAD(P)+ transhydrogenase subunit beta
MNMHFLSDLSYLIAAILFIFGMKRLSSPAGARSGNLLAMFGMFMAFAATLWLLHGHILNVGLMVTGIIIGSAIGAIGAWTVAMTAIPQMVALFNGVGGGAAALVATVEFLQHGSIGLPMLFATLIGSVSFTGSLVAFGKLQGVVTERPVTYPFQSVVNLILLSAIVLMGVYLSITATPLPFILLFGGSLILGVLMVLPIGGADMPVVISFLNAFTGLAVAADGFVISNDAMIIGGTLVGSSGTLLTLLMCRAMNRSLANVFFSSVGAAVTEGPSADSIYAGKVKSATADEIAMLLSNARRVVIVPGYGMAVSQAQHAVDDLMNLLEERGVEVEFAIHPVAGRMPGHMNVLLAEADIPYDKLKEMDEINPTFEQTDVAVVIGANDVVNPVARTDPKSPIAGMPILDVDKAKTVVVIKRSLSPGFAGIPNPLFAADNTLMFFHDGKKAILDLIGALKSL